MTNLFLAKGDTSFYITLVIIIAIFVVMLVLQSRRRKTAQAEYSGMIESLRPGARVKTVGGVIGRIVEIREEAPGFKTVLLETGTDKSKSFVLYDLQAIYGVVNDEAVARANAKSLDEQKPNPTNHEPANKGVDVPKESSETQKSRKKSDK